MRQNFLRVLALSVRVVLVQAYLTACSIWLRDSGMNVEPLLQVWLHGALPHQIILLRNNIEYVSTSMSLCHGFGLKICFAFGVIAEGAWLDLILNF